MESCKIFLLPGEIAVCKKPSIVATLLGSCIAICLYNKKLKVGGINHYMLASGKEMNEPAKYGDFAIDKLVKQMLALDPDKKNLEAYVIGGGEVIGHLNCGIEVGKKNIAMANQRLAEHGILVKRRDIGGSFGRKIYFNTHSGELEIQMIEKSSDTKEMEAKKSSLAGRKIKVLIVDDSSLIRGIIKRAVEKDQGIEVVGEAEDPYVAREKILELDPDVITLDIIMPRMDGITFLKKIMVYMPKPVIVVSSIAQKGKKQYLRAKAAGAVDVIDKEDLQLYQGIDTVYSLLTTKIKTAAVTLVKKMNAIEMEKI